MAKKQKTPKRKNEANLPIKQHTTYAKNASPTPYGHVITDLKKTLFLTFFILALQLGLFFVLT